MRKSAFAFLLLFLGLLVAAQQPTTDGVLEAERTLCRAYQSNDVAYMRDHVMPDYTLTDSKGVITTQQDDLSDAKTGKAKYTQFENRNMKVRLYGPSGSPDTAVVTGRTLVKGTYDNQPVDIEVQFTDTMVRQNGVWKLAAGHVSRIRQ
jgi:ketosteroid isomerase-like protein